MRLPGRRIEKDIDDEIAFHIESRARALADAGHPADVARRIAEAEFGDLAASRHELAVVDRRRRRRERLAHVIETIAQDFRYASRALDRSPAFTVTAIATLVIGVGAAVAVFAVVDHVLVRALPYPEADRLVGAWHDMPSIDLHRMNQSATTFLTYESESHAIDGIGIYNERAVNVADRSAQSDPQRIDAGWFTASLFSVLGVSPIRGRVFTQSEDAPTGAPVMLISEGFWRAHFGGDPKILGRMLEVNSVNREIIGVMPSNFRFPAAETEIWIPLSLDRANPPPSAFSYNAVARLKRGVSIAEAQRDFAAVLPRVLDLYPNFVPGITTRMMLDQAKPVPVLTPFREDVTGGIAGTLWMMAAAAALLLIVACVNVANLTIVRADARRRELAVREALGAGRVRVMRSYFSESALLAGVGGVLGLATGWGIVNALVTIGPAGIPRLAEIGIDARVVLFAAIITLIAAIVIGIIPMVRIARGSFALRGPSRGATADRGQQGVRSTLVGAQIALALVVVAASGLLLRSFERLHAIRPGFDADHVATFWMSVPRPRYDHDAEVVRFYSTLIERAAQIPAVEAVGLTSRLPLVARGVNRKRLYLEDTPSSTTTLPPLEILTTISGDYFQAMRIPLLAGTLFDPTARQREGDAIVSRRTASMLWRDSTGKAALGKRFRALPTGPWYTVVGVVGDTRDTTLGAPATPSVYFPEIVQRDTLTSQTVRTMTLVVRTSGDPSATVPAVRQIVREMDPTLPMFDVQPMTAALRASTARLAFTIVVLGAAALVTLTLGAVGLYGVLAYVVTLRRREIGIRIALGASPQAVAAATTRQGVRLTAVGIVCGLLLFAGVARFIRTFLFGVAPWDPAAVVGAALVLLAIATLASWIPARRAGQVDPAEALRAE
jgi:predicted permease